MAFDPAVGSEIRKTRPAVIVSNDAANRQLAWVVVIPLTSHTARQYPGEAVVTVGGQRNKAMADQIMAADKTRLKSWLGVLSKAGMRAVEDASRYSWDCRAEAGAACVLPYGKRHVSGLRFLLPDSGGKTLTLASASPGSLPSARSAGVPLRARAGARYSGKIIRPIAL